MAVRRLRPGRRRLIKASAAGLATAALILGNPSAMTQRTRPRVALARVPDGPAYGAPAPALTRVLWQLDAALRRHDLSAVETLIHPAGLAVAAYGGGLPDAGREVPARAPFFADLLGGADVAILGWREYGAEGVIVVADGWARRPLRLDGQGSPAMTSLGALGLVPVADTGTWRLRWLMFDGVGAMARDLNRDFWLPLPT